MRTLRAVWRHGWLVALALLGLRSLVLPGAAQAQDLTWAVRAGGASDDAASDIAVDAMGNSYVTGSFLGSATFGIGEVNPVVLNSAGSSDMFVAKYDADAVLLWARRAGGSDEDGGFSIAIDALGNSYLTGLFVGASVFGQGESNETVLTSTGSRDIFVAKYDDDGLLVWVIQAGGNNSNDHGEGIVADESGAVLLTGFFNESATFGVNETNEVTLTANGSFDAFTAKYASDGLLLWAKQSGGSFFDIGSDLAVDASGNSFVTGFFEGSATFGAGEVNETVLTSAGNRDIYIARYDADGGLLWAKRAGGQLSDAGSAVAVDPADGAFLSGAFEGTATFGAGQANATTLTSAGDRDLFVARYNADGLLQWAKRAGSPGVDQGSDIEVDALGSCFVTGHFEGSAVFGVGEANESILTSEGADDVFAATYDRNGSLLWARQAGGRSPDRGRVVDQGLGVGLDASGNAYVTGRFEGTATFGAGEANATMLTSSGDGDVFLARFEAESSSTTADDLPVVPAALALAQNYPNPFRAQTAIRYGLAHSAFIRLVIYDLLGRRVQLVDEGMRSQGWHRVTVSADQLAPGAYIYRLETGSAEAVSQVLLVR